MIPKRGDVGVATRYVSTKKINNVYGKETLDLRRCKCCGEIKPVTDFYHTTLKNGNKEPFPDCIECNDKGRSLRGKIQRRREKGVYVDKKLNPISNLDNFL